MHPSYHITTLMKARMSPSLYIRNTTHMHRLPHISSPDIRHSIPGSAVGLPVQFEWDRLICDCPLPRIRPVAPHRRGGVVHLAGCSQSRLRQAQQLGHRFCILRSIQPPGRPAPICLIGFDCESGPHWAGWSEKTRGLQSASPKNLPPPTRYSSTRYTATATLCPCTRQESSCWCR